MFSEQSWIFFSFFFSLFGYHLMVFIKTHNRNCFSLNFQLSLDLVELDFSWNNTLVSCPIDFCCKRNKSMWLCRLHLDVVKNKQPVSALFKEQLRFLCPSVSAQCPSGALWMGSCGSFWQRQAVLTFGNNPCLRHSTGHHERPCHEDFTHTHSLPLKDSQGYLPQLKRRFKKCSQRW